MENRRRRIVSEKRKDEKGDIGKMCKSKNITNEMYIKSTLVINPLT